MPSKVTVLAGQNNSGKSNVLRYVQSVLPRLASNGNQPPKGRSFTEADLPRGISSDQGHTFGVALPVTDDFLQSVSPELQDSLARVLQALQVDGYYWARFDTVGGEFAPHTEDATLAKASWGRGDVWQRQFRNVLQQLGGGRVDADDVMNRLLIALYKRFVPPDVATISGARRIETLEVDGPDADWLSGRGVIEELAQLQIPDHGNWEESIEKWEAINRFVQVVLGDPDARINIPHSAATIQVQTARRVLPLSNWGSGTEQVIVLASAATLLNDTLICVEEPETNLHPVLQKKLVSYLSTETSNQYLIATHSSHLLDSAGATSHHLRMTDIGTQVTPARRPHELVEICHDLGYRPSDLMQANCIVWVEGPTDRIYLRKWLEILDPELREGIEYSVMFYGGKLLSHLTLDDEALQDFVDLRRLNRFSAVVIDSDKTKAQAQINATKRRIRNEFIGDEAPGHVWVTKCYTIENYIPRGKLQAAVDSAHPGRLLSPGDEQWSNPLRGSAATTTARAWSFDKIAIAREVEASLDNGDLDRFDLRFQVRALAKFVRLANGLT